TFLRFSWLLAITGSRKPNLDMLSLSCLNASSSQVLGLYGAGLSSKIGMWCMTGGVFITSPFIKENALTGCEDLALRHKRLMAWRIIFVQNLKKLRHF